MDFLTWENAGMAALIILGLGTVVVVARLFRSGLGTYEQSKKSMDKRIRQTMAEMRERNKAMPVSEQTALLAAALEELLDLQGRPQGYFVMRSLGRVGLGTPEGELHIVHCARTTTLRGTKRVLHGAGQWEVRGPGEQRHSFVDLAALMRHLAILVRGEDVAGEEDLPPPLRRH